MGMDKEAIQTLLNHRDKMDKATVTALDRVADLVQHCGRRPSELRDEKQQELARLEDLYRKVAEAEDKVVLLTSAAKIVAATRSQ